MGFLFKKAKALSCEEDDIQQGTADGVCFPAVNG